MHYKSKNDYQKYPRSNMHTTIREDLYEEFQIFAIKIKQHQSKILDIVLEELLNNEDFKEKIEKEVKSY